MTGAGATAAGSTQGQNAGGIVQDTTEHVKKFRRYLLAFSTTVVAFLALEKPLSEFLGTDNKVVLVTVTLIPFLTALVYDFAPRLLRRRRRREMEKLAVEGELRDPGYFRVAPYGSSARDREAFKRRDNLEARVCDWVRTSVSGTLYLTGKSGSGKSSILSAYVLPELEAERTVVPVRTTFDPLSSLRESVGRPGAVYKKPPPDLDTLPPEALVAKVAEYAASKDRPLLLIFDQFEEYLVAKSLGLQPASAPRISADETTSEEDAADADFLQFLSSFPSSGAAGKSCRILLVVRSDYLGQLEELNLPALRQGENWIEVRPFTRTGARDFLAESGLELGTEIIERALEHAEAVEDTKGLVRPITLNIIGSFLAATTIRERQIVSRREMGTILRDYTLRAVGTAEDSWKLLALMITPAGSKRPPERVDRLAKLANLDPPVARGTLLQLANRGLVRRIDPDTDHWEISHDFVARLIERNAPNRRPEPLATASRAIASGLAVAWVMLAAIAYLQWRSGQDSALISEIQATESASVLSAEAGHVLKFAEAWDSRLSRADADERAEEIVGLANKFQKKPVVATIIHGQVSHPSAYDALSSLRTLRSLSLDDVEGEIDLHQLLIELDLYHLRLKPKGMWEISSQLLAKHRSLRWLSLRSVRIREPRQLEGLKEVECAHLRSVGVDPISLTRYWPELEELSVGGDEVVSVRALSDLNSLRRLGIANTAIVSLEPVFALPLEYLNIAGTKLSSLSGIGRLKRLELLNLSNLGSLDKLRVEELEPLPALRILVAKDNVVEGVAALSRFHNLEFIDLSGADVESDNLLESLSSLKKLKVVRLPTYPEIELGQCRAHLPGVECVSSRAPFDYADRWPDIAASVCASYDPA